MCLDKMKSSSAYACLRKDVQMAGGKCQNGLGCAAWLVDNMRSETATENNYAFKRFFHICS